MSKNVKAKSNAKASVKENTVLTSAKGYDPNRMVFSDLQKGSVPDSIITFKKVFVNTVNPDGSVGELIIPTERCFSFGVSINTSQETGEPNGYSLPICLWNREGPSKAEKVWTDTFNAIMDHTKDYLLKNKEELEEFEMDEGSLKRLNPLYWKKERGQIVKGTGPTLYAKLISNKPKKDKKDKKKNDRKNSDEKEDKDKKNEQKIRTIFTDANDNPIDPLNLVGKYGFVTAAIKFESIYFGGGKTIFQLKLHEAIYEAMDSGIKPLLSRPKSKGLLTGTSITMNDMPDDDEENEDKPKAGSLPVSEDEGDDDKDSGKDSGKDKVKETKKSPEKETKKVVRKVKKVTK